MILIWVAGVVVGLVAASGASKRAVIDALAASQLAQVSPALIGITVMAVGTDLPEIASSIAAALTGHGDVAVGDSAGSAMTQVTLILAILCVAMPPIRADRHTVGLIGTLTVIALVVDAVLVRDGLLTRWEGLALVSSWVAGLVVFRQIRPTVDGTVIDVGEADQPGGDGVGAPDRRGAVPYLVRSIAWLAVVAVAATVVVRSFVELTDAVGVPELIASSVVLALGTSLPELVVDWTAIRQGAVALAIGDLFGSSLVDATLALGSGPAIRSMVVSSDAALTCLIAGAGVAMATLITVRRAEHGPRSAMLLAASYLASVGGLVLWTSG